MCWCKWCRVSAIVNELRGEKIDIINWDENPAILIENALSPAKVIAVMADPDEKDCTCCGSGLPAFPCNR